MISIDFKNSDLIVSFEEIGLEIIIDECLYSGSKKLRETLNEIKYGDTSIKNQVKIKTVLWLLREILREKLNNSPYRDEEYQQLEVQYKEINTANEFLFFLLQTGQNGYNTINEIVNNPILELN